MLKGEHTYTHKVKGENRNKCAPQQMSLVLLHDCTTWSRGLANSNNHYHLYYQKKIISCWKKQCVNCHMWLILCIYIRLLFKGIKTDGQWNIIVMTANVSDCNFLQVRVLKKCKLQYFSLLWQSTPYAHPHTHTYSYMYMQTWPTHSLADSVRCVSKV